MHRQSKLKKNPKAGHQGPEWEQRYSSNISSTLAQHSGGHTPAALPPVKNDKASDKSNYC
jgi:hypothetical protein